jgi:hypothetical protein
VCVYDDFDHTLVAERLREFRDQVARRLSGELTEDGFKPLRLMNGVYLQLHAYVLRIAIPYGTLSSAQLHTLARIARKYDRNAAISPRPRSGSARRRDRRAKERLRSLKLVGLSTHSRASPFGGELAHRVGA